MSVPSNLKYTKDHEWVSIDGDVATIGITDFAQGELGDIVYVEVETLDETLEREEVFGKSKGGNVKSMLRHLIWLISGILSVYICILGLGTWPFIIPDSLYGARFVALLPIIVPGIRGM